MTIFVALVVLRFLEFGSFRFVSSLVYDGSLRPNLQLVQPWGVRRQAVGEREESAFVQPRALRDQARGRGKVSKTGEAIADDTFGATSRHQLRTEAVLRGE